MENPAAKSLLWVCNQIPDDLGDSNEERMLKCIKLYCKQGAEKIDEQEKKIEEKHKRIMELEQDIIYADENVFFRECNVTLKENEIKGKAVKEFAEWLSKRSNNLIYLELLKEFTEVQNERQSTQGKEKI